MTVVTRYTEEADSAAARSDYDPYTDAALLDPWQGYKELRDAAPAVWLTKYGMFALTRYGQVLLDWESFPSGNGVTMNDHVNELFRGGTLCSDGAEHDALRGVLGRPLNPRALRPIKEQINFEAESLVEKLAAGGTSTPRPIWRTTCP